MPRSLIYPIERDVWSVDFDGVPVTTKHVDSTDTYTIDFTNELDSGETVSSVSTTVSGVTLDSGSLSSPNYTITVTGTDGSIQIDATTSASRVLTKFVRFRSIPEVGRRVWDYRASR